MGLFRNFRLLVSGDLIRRMSELEARQDLLEEHVEGRLDSMKQYHARVVKRERDAQPNDQPRGKGNGTPHPNPIVQRLLARRAGRQLQLG